MCHESCYEFAREHLRPQDVRGGAVLEVGSLDLNGSLRPLVEALEPGSYLGVDIRKGPGVDELCDAAELVKRFGLESFDLLIATELLEHVRDWRTVVSNFKQVVRPDGVMLITTRSRGFPHHAHPHDFWRYEPGDVEVIFSDCIIEALEPDPQVPGVFLRVRKPRSFTENNLTGHALYSMVKGRPARTLSALGHRYYRTRQTLRACLSTLCPAPLKRLIKTRILKRP